MSDQAHDWTDEQISVMAEKIREVYDQAAKEMQAKLGEWLKAYEEERQLWEERVKSGDATAEDYQQWLSNMAVSRTWQQAMIDSLTNGAVNADELSRQLINDELPTIFAENANFGGFDVDTKLGYDTGFTLVDRDTVMRLISEDPQLLPMPEVDKYKDSQWNQKQFSNAVTQGILQGESVPNLAKRLRTVFDMDRKASIRAARTSFTSAEGAGRIHSYKRAEKIGISLQQEWLATLDLRTRHTHRLLDGQKVPVGGYFEPEGYGEKYRVRFPADPQGLPEMVWNCRCRVVGAVKGVDMSDAGRWSKLPDGMTYDEWKAGKGKPSDKAVKKIITNPQTEPEPQKKPHTNGGSAIWSQLGHHDSEAVRSKVESFLAGASGRAAELWAKFEDKLVYADPIHKDSHGKVKGAYFAPSTWITSGEHKFGVHMNLTKTLHDQKGVLSTWFHEFGHHIDFASRQGSLYATGDNNWEFGKIIKQEVEEYIKAVKNEADEQLKKLKQEQDLVGILKMGYTSSWANKYGGYYETALKHINDDKWLKDHQMQSVANLKTESARRQAIFDHYAEIAEVPSGKIGIQKVRDKIGNDITKGGLNMQLALGDIFDGATKGKCQDTYGHSASYWTSDCSKLAKESFAEFFSAECIYGENSEILDIMADRLPKSYAAYKSIVEGLLK